MWTAFGLLLGLALPLIGVTTVICMTFRGHHKREIRTRLEQQRIERDRETDRLTVMKQIWDDQVALQRQNIRPPALPHGFQDLQRRRAPGEEWES